MLTSPERILKASWISNPFALKKSFRPCSPETTTTLFYIHERCAIVNKKLTPSEQEGLTYAQESKLKQPLICYSKSPSEEVVALFHEGSDMREREMGEGGRSILVALIAATEKHDGQK
jgi:hypothetical protein